MFVILVNVKEIGGYHSGTKSCGLVNVKEIGRYCSGTKSCGLVNVKEIGGYRSGTKSCGLVNVGLWRSRRPGEMINKKSLRFSEG